MLGYRLHQLCEATGWSRFPYELRSMPLSAFRRWWSYIALRGDLDDSNAALWHLHEPTVDLISSIFSDD